MIAAPCDVRLQPAVLETRAQTDQQAGTPLQQMDSPDDHRGTIDASIEGEARREISDLDCPTVMVVQGVCKIAEFGR